MKVKNISLLICGFLLLFSGCQKNFLDRQPLSSITPDNFLVEESQLGAYAIARYGVFPVHGQTFGNDNASDVMTGTGYDNKYVPGQWKVGQTGGDWSFTDIFQCNYFLKTVLPRLKDGKIAGNIANINHYIGEIYMVRAYVYFTKLQALGDFPIVRNVLPDDKAILTAASKRSPRNEVARFILSDLDSAILLMKAVAPDGKRNRLSQPAAQLLKSRVALYEATWEKYFKGTAFVPNGPNWPGKAKNPNYVFPSGSLDNETAFFFAQAMASAKIVADATPLVSNNMVIQQTLADPVNPYFNMFSDVDMSVYPEVLFWKAYDKGLGIVHGAPMEVATGEGFGFTRGFVDGFLMANGLPIYAPGSGYAGDDSIQPVRLNRDGRLQIFLAQPGQVNILYFNVLGDHSVPIERYPDILNLVGNAWTSTGYCDRKGLNYDQAQYGNYQSWTGSIVFRGVEAYLNYIEACYESKGSLDATADTYWRKIRTRAALDPNYQKSIDATDMNQEAVNNWAAYSGGVLVDKTLFNIRRERGCELMAEGIRNQDLKRWRSLDQMITTPYHIEGFKLWGPIQKWYKASLLTYGIGDKSSVSSPALSKYYRPYEKTTTSLAYGGYKWNMAHYLNPIAIQHFIITSTDGIDLTTSPIYQNPGWGLVPNVGPSN
jgi:hypothetical protein